MYGNYNPYSYGYSNPMSQRLAELQQQQAYQQYSPNALQGPQNVQMLKGRVVASVEEAKAAQVDLDGTTSYFASPGEGKIYTKSIGMNGLPVFVVYEAKQTAAPQQPSGIEERLAVLESKVKELTNSEQRTTVSDVTTAGE